MATNWADSGLDLHVALDPHRKTGSLEDALREAIRDGRLAPGTRLPATRTLAADLGIARNSVAEVYARLVGEGWLDARVGAGTWVRERPAPAFAPVPQARVDRSTRFDLDLRGGLPDASAFPRSAWLAAVGRALAETPTDALGYGSPDGVERLRAALAEYLARTRGVQASADDVIVTHGFGGLLGLVARALAARSTPGASGGQAERAPSGQGAGRRVAVEAYGHVSHREVLEAAGLELVPLPIDADGARVDLLERLDVSAVLLTPAHQFPTGVPLSRSRREALAAWAMRTGGFVIEDDYDGEFRFDGRSIGAFQPLAPERTVYSGTASKALSPALGLGWGVVPAELRDDVRAERARTGGATDALAQLALAALIASGGYDRSVRELRRRYRGRRERFEELVAERLPDARVGGIAAGIQCLLELPPGVTEAVVVAEASARGLRIGGLAEYAAEADLAADAAIGSSGRPALVVGIGAPPQHRFEQAMAVVVAAVDAA
ncbi:aminotransferase class I/II-fold pyridoxal phosphate-dependent enzyme [Agromyces sp. CFH 90414]|uniref:Aminotransferase class I/II-fold pyridoxal phosphate-dependent enzyme n=1 Tax=Agromyces agglutinans TaxID=2662258 RepID=A0A6I2F3Z2_9MICO|nr:PLP-dependent aminotransferase family protein [Agromyces agglutinans]MRG59302.1 aminotransferase class I/II-fold pyridoxal phosphate-dependent enzyme [Agromyces agglutinans]